MRVDKHPYVVANEEVKEGAIALISLTLPLPPSINKTSRTGVNRQTGKVYKPHAHLKTEYKSWVLLSVKAAGLAGMKLDGALSLTVRWYYPNYRVQDADNGLKLLLDSLAEAIGFNDKRVTQIHIYRTVEKGTKARCEIEIRELEYEEGA